MMLENARLKRELTQSMKSTAKTFSLHARRGLSRETHLRDKSTPMGLNDTIDHSREPTFSSRGAERTKLTSARRTLRVQDDKK